MEKLEHYQKILTDFVEDFAKKPFSVQKNLENQALIDTKNNHFQVVTIGWDKSTFVYNPILHFDIKNEKIWIQQNWTDILLDIELMKMGVDKNDIVLGFLPLYAREQSGYAVS
jgi:XisI protein